MGNDGGSVDDGSEDADGSFSNDTAGLFTGLAGSPGSNARKDGSRKEWAAWEDEAIRNGVQKLGLRWRAIAAELPGRSDDAVRNRWARLQQSACGTKPAAAPRVKREGAEQRQSWSEEEDRIISSSVLEYGHRWNRIAERLPRRTEHAIRNRWHRLQMRSLEDGGCNISEISSPAETLPKTGATAPLPGRVTVPLTPPKPASASGPGADSGAIGVADGRAEGRAEGRADGRADLELRPRDFELRSRDLDPAEMDAEMDAQGFFSDELPTGFDFDSMLAAV